MMTDNERKRLRELNSKNEEFNKRLYENWRTIKEVCLRSAYWHC